MESEFVVLRIIHIVAGSFWVGAAVFLAAILEPTLEALGPGIKGPVMSSLSRKIGPMIGITATLTIVAGIVLAFRLEATGRVVFDSAWGVAILLGFIVSVLAFGTGITTGIAANGMARLGAQVQSADGPPPPEILAKMNVLGDRLKIAGRSTAVLTLVGVGAMASARFV
jgi:uncharacterized membrane protein